MRQVSPVPGVFHRQRLLAGGFSDSEIDSSLKSGAWERLHCGAYAPPLINATDLELYRRRVVAVAAKAPEYVICGASAAVLHGAPVWGVNYDDVHLLRTTSTGAGHSSGRRIHSGLLDLGETVRCPDVLATSPARTFFDLARWESVATAVVSGDWFLAQQRRFAEDVVDLISRHPRVHGLGAVRRALTDLDARSESPGESLTRLALVHGGLPRPEAQIAISTPAGQFVARSDLGYPEFAVVIEFDGRVKYHRGGFNGDRAIEDVLFAEKQREDRLRAVGVTIVRVVWDELGKPEQLVARVERAITLGRRSVEAGLVTARFTPARAF